ncbi:MAG: colicin E3/pyocin S6 family cytotoxin [Stellaceae bacterium]
MTPSLMPISHSVVSAAVATVPLRITRSYSLMPTPSLEPNRDCVALPAMTRTTAPSIMRCLQRTWVDEIRRGAVTPKPIPRPSILDEFEYLGAPHSERRRRSDGGKRLYTWDALHGEVEVFNGWGRRLGSMDPIIGEMIKPAVPGRTIDVSARLWPICSRTDRASGFGKAAKRVMG